jgi:hypothetical protein
MHGECRYARRFRAPGELRRDDGIFVPAEPHLERDRNAHGGDRGFDQPHRAVGIAQQSRARLAGDHVLGGTAHVDVDDVRAGAFGDTRAFGEPARLAAGELHHVQADALAFGAERRRRIALGQPFACDHF